ncbi:response regulator [Sphingomonas sp.]|uniref:response regulator transcription factor n=1 Tax=Sphingomonas sp. TaxID=28214 RepID=UPI001B1C83D4|nr:response regulator [Sphingomonas sp.]MBO9714988.1 response regulator transcription factor [Sphingomonas sp.]
MQQNVHLVEDDDLVRKSTSFLLSNSGYRVAAYGSGEEFLEEVGDSPSGCVLLDVQLPGISGLQVQSQLNERGISIPVIVLTGHGDIATAIAAMKSGATDFIEKPFDQALLLGAIDAAFDRFEEARASGSVSHGAKVRLDALSNREQDVLRGLVEGKANKVIAHDLGISPRTVEVYRANLMGKLGVRSLSEALRIAFAAGLMDGE